MCRAFAPMEADMWRRLLSRHFGAGIRWGIGALVAGKVPVFISDFAGAGLPRITVLMARCSKPPMPPYFAWFFSHL